MSDLNKNEWHVIEYCDYHTEMGLKGYLTKNGIEAIMVAGFCRNCTTYKAVVPAEAKTIDDFERS
jgi:hypothetical protein